jgi:hypothetical protein
MTWLQMGKTLSLLLVLSTLRGCTALGFATDMAFYTVLGPPKNGGSNNNNDEHENPLPFTTIGLEQDAKVVSKFLSDAAKSNAEIAPVAQDSPLFPANYANKKVCEQANSLVTECYSAEYFQTFYQQAQSNKVPVNSEAVEQHSELQQN